MRGAALAILILALFVACTDNARAAAVSSDHYLAVSRYVAAQERQREREQKYRRLRQRYLHWRQWRRDDVRERVHAYAVAGLGDGYGKYAPAGVPWCALYVSYCVSRGERGHPLPSNPASTSSWRAAIRAGTRGLRRVYERANVRPGDVVTFPYGHTGIVHRPTGGGFWCIEGNCTGAVRLRWHGWWEVDTVGRVLFTRIPERFQCIAQD